MGGMLMSEDIWQRSDNWVGSEIEDSFVMINIDTGKYVALNRTASAVWDALDQPRTQGEIEHRLEAAFEVSADQCHQAVSRLLGELRELELAAPR